jgi:hypothetical protein
MISPRVFPTLAPKLRSHVGQPSMRGQALRASGMVVSLSIGGTITDVAWWFAADHTCRAPRAVAAGVVAA